MGLLGVTRLFVVQRFCPLPADLCATATDLVNNLIPSSLAALVISVLIFLLTPRVVRKAELSILDPREIGPRLDEIRRGSNRYWFAGIPTEVAWSLACLVANRGGHREVVGMAADIMMARQATGLYCGATSAFLAGQTFQGSDSIRTVGCK